MKNKDNVEEKNKMHNRRKINHKEKGITLIALVITIIILLILAGVTINTALSENGLFKRAKTSAERYNLESEREALSLSVASYQAGEIFNDTIKEGNKLGKDLNKKSLQHSSDWHIVEVGDTAYEEGWNYVEKGSNIEGYGQARNSWLVNYETGEIIQLEEDNYLSLSAGDMIAVTDNLIINVDSSIIDKGTEQSKAAIEKQLGDGVTLEGFNFENENSGLTSTSFNFDGVDDYIKVPYDKEWQKKALKEQGFTFEFYGRLMPMQENDYNGYGGIFCYWNGDEKKQARMRFGVSSKKNDVVWNAGQYGGISDFSESKADPHNIHYVFENGNDIFEKEVYVTVTLDVTDEYFVENGDYYCSLDTANLGAKEKGYYYKHKVFINGNCVFEGDYNKKQWDNFINDNLDSLKYFCIGRSSMLRDGNWIYSKMKAYCLRLYSRALKDKEVKANYDKATKYHTLLEGE